MPFLHSPSSTVHREDISWRGQCHFPSTPLVQTVLIHGTSNNICLCTSQIYLFLALLNQDGTVTGSAFRCVIPICIPLPTLHPICFGSCWIWRKKRIWRGVNPHCLLYPRPGAWGPCTCVGQWKLLWRISGIRHMPYMHIGTIHLEKPPVTVSNLHLCWIPARNGFLCRQSDHYY